MQITIVNGNPNGQNKVFDEYLAEYQNKLCAAGHIVKTFLIREMELGFCGGCFNCWHTTPGICRLEDDINQIHRAVINANLVVWASPLIKGYFSSLLKKVQERMIPLLLPYVEIVYGEIHHCKRYGHYPAYGVIVEKESDTEVEELQIIHKIQERYALNFRSKLNFFMSTEKPVSEAVDETIRGIRSEVVLRMDLKSVDRSALDLYTSSLN